MARAFVGDAGEGEQAIRWYQENMRIYPSASGPRPDAQHIPFSQQSLRTTHWSDLRFFDELAEAVQYEPSGAFTPYELGVLKSLGIEKGKPFAPMHA